MRRRNRQRGMTLVELLVSMAVTSIILTGLTGVFFNVSSRYQEWSTRINAASAGAGLEAALQADSHRYVPCGLYQHRPTLNLCPADDTANWAVRYLISPSAPWVISREARGKPPAFMARSALRTAPDFWADCFDGGGMIGGHIHIYNLRVDDGSGDPGPPSSENFSVYYAAPWRPGCPPPE